VVVDIKSKNTIITIYRNNEVVGIENYPYGSNEIFNNVKAMLKIDSSINILALLDNLNNLDYVNEQVSLINKYDERFLSICEANSYDLKKCLTLSIKRFMNDICNLITSKKTNVECVNLNVNDELFNSITLIDFDSLKLPLKFKLLTNDIIGLEEKNVCNLLASINYVYGLQTLGDFQYSIDNFVSQEISFTQAKQNILLKLGLISTK
jgi:hypothetical protein